MKIGVPKEIKNNECRVGLTPNSVKYLIEEGHQLYIESNAGFDIGFTDENYKNAGAEIIHNKKELFVTANIIIKVKEPIPEEFNLFNDSHILFTYLHLAADLENAQKLAETGVTAIAYETIISEAGSMPLLAPMSKIAGQISLVVGSYYLLKPNKGIGTIFGNFDGIELRVVTVIGAGVAGTEAIKKALANNAYVKVIDLSPERLKALKMEFGDENIDYIISSKENILDALSVSDLVIGSVYVIGKEAPKVITKDMLSVMKQGSVIVDISIDQGGCIETSRPTTHDKPIFVEDGVIHYCVTNMPGAVPLTATLALNEVTLSYISMLANIGSKEALYDNKYLASGLSLSDGKIIHPALKDTL